MEKTVIELILNDVENKYRDQIILNANLLNIYEGNLLPYVEKELQKQLSSQAYSRAKERIAPINVLTKLVDKTAKTYAFGVERKAGDEKQQELLSGYEDSLNVDTVMSLAEKMLMLHKYTSIEFFIENGEIYCRVVPADRFHVFAANPQFPMTMTHYVKFLGEDFSQAPRTDQDGGLAKLGEAETIDRVRVYKIISDEEIVVVESNGYVRSTEPNILQMIPYIYLNTSQFDLIPVPSTDLQKMTTLIPVLLTDLNYAIQYQSHSLFYGIDIELPQNMKANPDSFLNFNSKQGDGTSPQVGTIEPKVNIDAVIGLIKSQIGLWLETMGLKAGTMGAVTAENASSGIAKIIDEADTTEIRKEHAKIFKGYENEFWEKVGYINNTVVPSIGATEDFIPFVTFQDPKPVVDENKEVERIVMKLDNRLTSHKQALRDANPDLDEDAIDQLYNEILAESITLGSIITDEKVDDDDEAIN